jgi:hypothetical protein
MKKPKRKYQELSPDEKGDYEHLLSLRDEMLREHARLSRVVASHKRYSEVDRQQARLALNEFYNDKKKVESAMNNLVCGRKP